MVLDLSAIPPKADIAERDAGSGVSLLKVPPQQEIKRISTTNQPRGKAFYFSFRHSPDDSRTEERIASLSRLFCVPSIRVSSAIRSGDNDPTSPTLENK